MTRIYTEEKTSEDLFMCQSDKQQVADIEEVV